MKQSIAIIQNKVSATQFFGLFICLLSEILNNISTDNIIRFLYYTLAASITPRLIYKFCITAAHKLRENGSEMSRDNSFRTKALKTIHQPVCRTRYKLRPVPMTNVCGETMPAY